MAQARPLEPEDPRRLGDYELVSRLGAGPHGVVYLGHSPAGGSVAAKLLPAADVDDPAVQARFLREFDRARQIVSLGTAAVLSADHAGGRPYIVSEFVAGPSLAELVAAEGPRGGNSLRIIALGTATALAALHEAGIVHGRHKPSNVLLGPDGPRLTDFGMGGALPPAGAVGDPGDPAFCAPEQLNELGTETAADVWAWGATMYHAAVGAPPFGAESDASVRQRVLYEHPDLRALPDWLRELVAEALDKDPQQRPPARRLVVRLLEAGPDGLPEPLLAEATALVGARPQQRQWPAAPVADGTLGAGEPDGYQMTAVQPLPQGWDGYSDPHAATAGFEPVADLHAGPASRSRWPLRRPGNAMLGVLVSLAIGVLAGSAIIVLVLWPALRGGKSDDGARSGGTTAPGDRQVSSIPAAFAGDWKGTAVNPRRGAAFPVQVTFQEGATTADVTYPKQGCTGVLTFNRGTENRLEMGLAVSKACTSGTVIVTRKPDGSLTYAWSRPGTQLTYQATLTGG